MNCFQISIFIPKGTINEDDTFSDMLLWIAFKLVSLYRKEQWQETWTWRTIVVNCFQISIFIPKGTIHHWSKGTDDRLWIAFKLVSLYRKEQSYLFQCYWSWVVNCFQISIFIPKGTIRQTNECTRTGVVNCFQISIFIPKGTIDPWCSLGQQPLWIAFKLVSLYRKEQFLFVIDPPYLVVNCFQISIFIPKGTITDDNKVTVNSCELLSN